MNDKVLKVLTWPDDMATILDSIYEEEYRARMAMTLENREAYDKVQQHMYNTMVYGTLDAPLPFDEEDKEDKVSNSEN